MRGAKWMLTFLRKRPQMEVWVWLRPDWRIHSDFPQALEDMWKESFFYHCKQQDCWPSSLWTKGVEETTHSPSHCGLVLKRGANGVRHAVGVWNWTHWRKGSICWAWPHSTDVDGPQDEVMLTNSQVFLILLVQDHTEQTGSRFPDSYAYNQPWYCQTVEFMLAPLLSPGPGVAK